MLALLKFVDSQARDHNGRFSGTRSVAGGKMAPAVIHGDGPRSLTRGEGWQRTGSKIAEIPSGYTGSKERELPHGSFTTHKLTHQIPATMDLREDAALRHKLFAIVKANKDGAIETGTKRGLIPEGTDPHTVTRAYNHGAMLGLHDHGAVDYDFKMDDALKEQMTPLKDFIRFSRRRVISQAHGMEKGSWRPYRAAFGQPFKDGRKDKITGATRLRVRPNDVLVKAAIPGPLGVGGLQPLPQGVNDRWHNQRLLLARKENQGGRSYKQLTLAQRAERKHAANDERLKDHSGAPKLLQGQLGSIAGDHVSKRPSLTPPPSGGMHIGTPSGGPRLKVGGPAAPKLPGAAQGLAKKAHPAAHDMMPDALKHITAPKPKVVAPKQVMAMMGTVNAILAAGARRHDPRPQRFAHAQAVGDHKASIAHLAR